MRALLLGLALLAPAAPALAIDISAPTSSSSTGTHTDGGNASFSNVTMAYGESTGNFKVGGWLLIQGASVNALGSIASLSTANFNGVGAGPSITASSGTIPTLAGIVTFTGASVTARGSLLTASTFTVEGGSVLKTSNTVMGPERLEGDLTALGSGVFTSTLNANGIGAGPSVTATSGTLTTLTSPAGADLSITAPLGQQTLFQKGGFTRAAIEADDDFAIGASSLVVKGASGFVGIGDPAPSQELQLLDTGTDETFMVLENNSNASGSASIYEAKAGGGRMLLGRFPPAHSSRASEAWWLQVGAFPLVFGTADAERGRFTNTGNFQVNYGVTAATGTFGPTFMLSTGAYTASLGQTTARSCATGVTTDAAGVFDGCVASDRSLKASIASLRYDPKAIDSLRPVSYRWKKGTGRDAGEHIGFIAQEVNEVSPQAVIPAGVGLSGIDPNAVLALVVKELQTLRKRVAELEKK